MDDHVPIIIAGDPARVRALGHGGVKSSLVLLSAEVLPLQIVRSSPWADREVAKAETRVDGETYKERG